MNTRISILYFIITNEFSNKQTIRKVQYSFDTLLASELSYKAFLSTLVRIHQLSYVSRSLTHYTAHSFFYHYNTLYLIIYLLERSHAYDYYVLKLPFRDIHEFIPILVHIHYANYISPFRPSVSYTLYTTLLCRLHTLRK